MKIELTALAAAIKSAMQDYLDNDGSLGCHNPCLYVSDPDAGTADVCYGSALETPGCVVLWDLQEGLGNWTPEKGDDLDAISAGAADILLPDLQDSLDSKLEEMA
jgi:hypothetical protein